MQTVLPDHVALAGGTYQLDLRRAHAVTFTASSASTGSGLIEIRAAVDGAGRHSFSMRADNLELSDPTITTLDLGAHATHEIVWHARILNPSTPWVAVVLQDGALSGHAELSGIAQSHLAAEHFAADQKP